MRILAIETSCDDTAAAVVDSELRVLASVVSSQNEIHARFGGIVPELASRRHIEMIRPVVDQALAEADLTLDDIDLAILGSLRDLAVEELVRREQGAPAP